MYILTYMSGGFQLSKKLDEDIYPAVQKFFDTILRCISNDPLEFLVDTLPYPQAVTFCTLVRDFCFPDIEVLSLLAVYILRHREMISPYNAH